jgi:hypothetical protein
MKKYLPNDNIVKNGEGDKFQNLSTRLDHEPGR